ncbi:MAG: hypothetical protein ACLTDR_06285 [Adlercreutzia equolifaciens]
MVVFAPHGDSPRCTPGTASSGSGTPTTTRENASRSAVVNQDAGGSSPRSPARLNVGERIVRFPSCRREADQLHWEFTDRVRGCERGWKSGRALRGLCHPRAFHR